MWERDKLRGLDAVKTGRNGAILVALLVATIAPPTWADAAEITASSLPTARRGTSAVWTGTHAFIFGGEDIGGPSDEITRFDPTTGAVTTMTTTFSHGLDGSSAVWTGTFAFQFGGFIDTGAASGQISKYNPATDTMTFPASLPSNRLDTSAVWDGTNAYIFGGSFATGRLDEIVRYTPATSTVTTMTATLPTARSGTSAIWDGTNAYIFGGYDGAPLNDILRYNPATGTVTKMSSTLPTARSGTSAVWDGTSAYVFGGDEIVRYNPATNTVTSMGAYLPTGRSWTSAVWDGANAYVFGGYDGSWLDDIVRYNPVEVDVPSEPRGLSASPGPGAGELTLAWQAPAHADALAEYRVYRSTASFGTYTQVGTAGGSMPTYKDTGLPNGVTRFYRVSAVNADGEGPRSNIASATTFNDPPSAPQTLLAHPGPGIGQVTLRWDPPAEPGNLPVVEYRVYRGMAHGGPYALVATVPASQAAYMDSGRPVGNLFFYVVSADNSVEEGPVSNEAAAPGTQP